MNGLNAFNEINPKAIEQILKRTGAHGVVTGKGLVIPSVGKIETM